MHGYFKPAPTRTLETSEFLSVARLLYHMGTSLLSGATSYTGALVDYGISKSQLSALSDHKEEGFPV